MSDIRNPSKIVSILRQKVERSLLSSLILFSAFQLKTF
jgi:hypothetical protein